MHTLTNLHIHRNVLPWTHAHVRILPLTPLMLDMPPFTCAWVFKPQRGKIYQETKVTTLWLGMWKTFSTRCLDDVDIKSMRSGPHFLLPHQYAQSWQISSATRRC